MSGLFVFLVLAFTVLDSIGPMTSSLCYGRVPFILPVAIILIISTGLLLNSHFLAVGRLGRIFPVRWKRDLCGLGLCVCIWIFSLLYLTVIMTVRITPPRPLSENEIELVGTRCPQQDWKYRQEKNVFLVRRNSEAQEQIERYVGNMSRNLEQAK
ncbi:MAG TPA: hypothetical protein PKH31_12635 [Candidatus Sumerlaeota bacterium]|nr:hypothetical protein [Candidatus Sumerlaeota bacterium]